MYPPQMLYQIARRQQADELGRAEARRRSHLAPRSKEVRGSAIPARSGRRRLARVAAALAVSGRH